MLLVTGLCFTLLSCLVPRSVGVIRGDNMPWWTDFYCQVIIAVGLWRITATYHGDVNMSIMEYTGPQRAFLMS